MKKYFIKDKIRDGQITHNIGDIVNLSYRKKNGYPKFLKYDVDYIIKKVENDFVFLHLPIDGVYTFVELVKINKIYVCNKSQLRDIKINDILKH